jgi:hypothetical protein
MVKEVLVAAEVGAILTFNTLEIFTIYCRFKENNTNKSEQLYSQLLLCQLIKKSK